MAGDFEIDGMSALFVALDNYTGELEAAAQTVLEETIINTDADIKQSITDQGMVDTGRYRSSWKFTIGNLEATESSNVEYGPFLELGTSKMKARPHVFPAFEKNSARFIAALKAL